MEPLELPAEIELPDPTEEDYASVREMYPHFTEEQVREAAYNLDRYVEGAWKQFARIYKDPIEYELLKYWLDEEKKRQEDEEGFKAKSPLHESKDQPYQAS